MSETGTFPIGTEGIGSTVVRDPPSVTITSPLSSITSTLATVTWTYHSNVPRTQDFFRVQLRNILGEAILYDSANLAGTDVTYDIPFQLSPQSSYQIWVQASDGLDWSAWAVTSFLVDAEEVTELGDRRDVGTVYEIAINGVGYMLDDHPDDPERRYRRQAGLLDPQRFATGETPFSEAVGRYSFLYHTSFIGGAGQRYRDVEAGLAEAYFYSEGVNPFVEGELSLLPAAVEQHNDGGRAITVGDTLYVLTNTNELTSLGNDPGDTASTFAPLASGTVVDIASDGVFWYATDGTIIRRSSTTTPADWSIIPVDELAWTGDRVVGLKNGSAAVVTTLAPDGAEEVASGRFTHTDSTVAGATGGDGYLYYGLRRGTTYAEIRSWQLGNEEIGSVTALTLPPNEYVEPGGLYFYLGNVFVATRQDTPGSITPAGRTIRIYRCVAQQGLLTPQLITSFEVPATAQPTRFAGDSTTVVWSWPTMHRDDNSGMGAIDLTSSGWTRWIHAVDTTDVYGVFHWGGQFGFTTLTKTWSPAAIDSTTIAPVATGFLETSVADQASDMSKSYDLVKVTSRPLPSGAVITVERSLDSNESFLSVLTNNTAGTKVAEQPLVLLGTSIGLRIILQATTDSPVVESVGIKLHPLGLGDQIVTLPINCSDDMAGMNGVTLTADVGKGFGTRRARRLEAFVGQQVRLQDIDWPVTRTAQVYDVIGADSSTIGVFNRNVGRRDDKLRVTLTLLRSVT